MKERDNDYNGIGQLTIDIVRIVVCIQKNKKIGTSSVREGERECGR